MAIGYVVPNVIDPETQEVLNYYAEGFGIIQPANASAYTGPGYYNINITDDGSVITSAYAPTAPSSATTTAAAAASSAAAASAPAASASSAPASGSGSTGGSSSPSAPIGGASAPQKRRINAQYFGEDPGGLGTQWQGAGFYNPFEGTRQGEFGNESFTGYNFLGATDPNLATSFGPGDTALFNVLPETGRYIPQVDASGNVQWRADTGTGEGFTRDEMLAQHLAGTGVNPEMVKQFAAQRGLDLGQLLNVGVAPQYHVGATAVERSAPGGATVRGTNPFGGLMAMLQTGGVDWRNDPQLAEMWRAGQERAEKEADAIQKSQAKYGGNFLMNVALPGLMTWAPALGGALAPAAQGAGLGGMLAGISAANPLPALGLKALGLVNPQLGQIAGLAGGISGLSGMLGGPTISSLTGLGGPGPTQVFGDLIDTPDWAMPDVASAEDAFLGQALNRNYADYLGQIADNADSYLGGAMRDMAPDAGQGAAPTAPTAPTAPAAPEAPAPAGERGEFDLGKTAKVASSAFSLARQVQSLLGGEDSPSAAAERRVRPVREEGQTDQQYAQEVADFAVQYLDLDTKAMAKAGLKPGSPEYTAYILQQADSVIQQIFSKGGLEEGETVADLQTQLKDLTRKELLQLDRAMFVRGELGKLMGSGEYLDPFTGQREQVEGEGMFSGGRAAYQRGLARSTDELAGLRGSEARRYLGGMLGRKSDLYGLQATQDADLLRARLLADENLSEEERRRRMAAAEKGDWAEVFGGAQNINADTLFRGVDAEGAQAALLQAIFGE